MARLGTVVSVGRARGATDEVQHNCLASGSNCLVQVGYRGDVDVEVSGDNVTTPDSRTWDVLSSLLHPLHAFLANGGAYAKHEAMVLITGGAGVWEREIWFSFGKSSIEKCDAVRCEHMMQAHCPVCCCHESGEVAGRKCMSSALSADL